jgi:hypothetical protein
MDKKIQLTSILIGALLTSILIYYLYISFIIDPYLETYQKLGRIPATYEFYESNFDEPNKIFYFSSSVFKEGLDTSEIDNVMNKNSDIIWNNYNLGDSMSSPLQRLVQLDHIFESKPKLVVIGLIHQSLSDNVIIPDDQLAAASPFIHVDENTKTAELLGDLTEWANLNEFEYFLYKRKYLFGSLETYIKNFLNFGIVIEHKDHNTNFKESLLYPDHPKQDESSFQKNLEKDKKPGYFEFFVVSNESTRNKQGLELFIEELQKKNIKVVIVKMPINPVLTIFVNKTYRANYNNYLENVGKKFNVTVLNFEDRFNYSLFYDSHHLNKKGKKLFSRELGTSINKELE